MMATPQFTHMGVSNTLPTNLSFLNPLSQSPMMQPSLPRNLLNLSANQSLLPNPMVFRSANRGSFLDYSSNMPRNSFNEFGTSADTLLNSTMTRPPNMTLQGPGVNDLLQNQMPGHKMSIDFTSGRPSDNK